MIYNRDESEVTTLGEIEKHSVSIDAKNINHIVTILSSNLYSYPMISFLRETVSNAVDSHVEAGVNEPIIITRTKDDISIRDFGTGISPERFETIYLNIGSSTKRESNEYIGSFGIGRFSCLSVSKLANITSFYNGKAYYYVMNMDIDQLHIDKVYELDTTEHNGVEVKIPLSSFNADNLDCLSFIENVYVECDGDDYNNDAIQEFNKRKIHSFTNFKTITYEYRHSNDKTEILLGKIPYAVDYMSLWDYNDEWHKSWKEAMKSIYPCINIGEVDITPNRETLIYSDKTKERLRAAYEDCILELTGYWNEHCDTEYDDFFTWAKELTMWRRNSLTLEDTYIEISDQLPFNAKLKGHPEWDNVDPKEKKKITQSLMNTSLDTLGEFINNTIYKGRKETSITAKNLLEDWVFDRYSKDRMVLVVPSQNGFSGKYFKNFLGFKYPNKNIIFLRRQRVNHYELKSFIRRIWGATMITDKLYCHFVVSLLKELYRTIKAHATYHDIMASPEYQQYKKEHQDPRSYVAKHTGKITFTLINTDYYHANKHNMTIDEMITYIKKNYKHYRVVYSTLDSPFLAAFHKIQYPNLIILSAAKNNMKYLEEGLPEYIRPIEELYVPDNRVLIKYKTARFIYSQPQIAFKPYKVFPPHIQMELKAIEYYCNKYDLLGTNSSYPYVDTPTLENLLSIIPSDVYDLDMLGQFNKLLPYMKLSYKIENSLAMYGGPAELKYYILMKAKKIRPSYQYYKIIKEQVNKVINAL